MPTSGRRPGAPGLVNRVPELERELAEQAGRLIGLAPRARELVALAQRRAHHGPLRDFGSRPWGRERAEELADDFNYAAWDLLELTSRTDDDALAARELLVVHAADLIRAFDSSQLVRALLGR